MGDMEAGDRRSQMRASVNVRKSQIDAEVQQFQEDVKNVKSRRCNTPCRCFCSILFIIIWLLFFYAWTFFLVSCDQLIPYLQNFKSNLRKGFDEALKFEDLKADATKVKDSCVAALAKCSVVVTTPADFDCATLPQAPAQPGPTASQQQRDAYTNAMNNLPRATTTPEKNKITDAFSNSLTIVQKVANDKYLGKDEFANTAESLNNITTTLKTLPTYNAICLTTNPAYCKMMQNADSITEKLDPVEQGIANLTDNKYVNEMHDLREHVPKMQYWPAFLMLAWLIWSCFWCYGEATCCSSCCGCYCLFWFWWFWLVFFTVKSLIIAGAIATKHMAAEQRIDFLPNSPTVDELLDHIEAEFPKFYEYVFEDLIDGLEKLNFAAQVFAGVCLMMLFYSYYICCCCRPYATEKKLDKE